ncbi:MAG TPA: hypothetical protein VHM67_16340 [Gemmatimonadaceae bacterium]|nr:hypothetical protein [Gemmatimonadaceae bacterium]
MVAGLTARAEDAIRALRTLPDNAGPAAFLAKLRTESERRTQDPVDRIA